MIEIVLDFQNSYPQAVSSGVRVHLVAGFMLETTSTASSLPAAISNAIRTAAAHVRCPFARSSLVLAVTVNSSAAGDQFHGSHFDSSRYDPKRGEIGHANSTSVHCVTTSFSGRLRRWAVLERELGSLPAPASPADQS